MFLFLNTKAVRKQQDFASSKENMSGVANLHSLSFRINIIFFCIMDQHLVHFLNLREVL